ncbi:hypothetical protein [Arenimonas oryziterrae]|uniref:Uncharacterized protein n=1 Tax=Arenimonas oryziterrae DSM 21050 = YC6267 TaxID=1121015 RepID=A0A091AWM5_9GAMM|nr:hypothetical protein [Arenimonas oryziterrae]KFN43054.1 hypothetical protein N789_10860 [Arenimonas oryziterrae DSM 21050 = YC6267]
MNKPNSKYLLIALVPAVLTPIALLIEKQHQATYFLGLSSSFWSGTAIGVSIGAGVVAIALLARAMHSDGGRPSAS